MTNKQITVTLGWLAIYAGWVGAFVLWFISALIGERSLGQLAILVVAGAATATVRGYFVEHDEGVKNIITVLRLGDPGDDPGRIRPVR